MPPKPSRAVTEDKAPEVIEAEDPIRARWRQLEWFATPPFASRAGAELIHALHPGVASAWEPCCADGIMAACLGETIPLVHASDLQLQDGPARPNTAFTFDFLLDTHGAPEVDWIITNPPFASAPDFVRLGLQRARRGVAIIQRLAFLETPDRYQLNFESPVGLSVFAPFIERVAMHLGPWKPEAGTATAYAWFIYDKEWRGEAVVRPIPPGSKDRLSRRDDIRRFVKPAVGTLL